MCFIIRYWRGGWACLLLLLLVFVDWCKFSFGLAVRGREERGRRNVKVNTVHRHDTIGGRRRSRARIPAVGRVSSVGVGHTRQESTRNTQDPP